MMRFRFSIKEMLYAIAVLSAGMATYGGVMGLIVVFFLMVPHLTQLACPYWDGRSSLIVATLTITALLSWVSGPFGDATQAARDSASLGQSHWNTKRLALAILDYKASNGGFPPPYLTDGDGNKLHSWRTLILPHLGQETLFNKIDLSEPYNSPKNLKVFQGVELEVMKNFQPFADGRDPNEASYLAVVDNRTMWPPSGQAITAVPDGEAETLLLVEVGKSGVAWYEPEDLSLDQALVLLTHPRRHQREDFFYTTTHSDRRVITTAIGSQMSIGSLASHDQALALLTRDGGEDGCDLDVIELRPSLSNRHLKWERLAAACLLVALALLPAFKRTRAWLSP